MAVQYSWAPDDNDDLSELTDIEDEEEPAPPPPPPSSSSRRATEPRPPTPPLRTKSTRPATQSATETSKQKVGKGAQPLLRPPRSITFSVSALYDLIKQGLIDLDPEYQRGVVWTDKKQSELINSIFDNYYVPPVVLSVSRSRDGGETRVCIDGKQRLTSICQFMDGNIPYKDSVSLRKVHYTKIKGSKRKVLTERQQNTFKNKQITCMEYDDLKPEEEREIFQRVQLGVSLSPADRLPALNGPYADLVRQMRRRIEFTPGFSGYLEWGKARGKDFQALGQSVYLIVYGKTSAKADPTPTRLETFLSLPSAAKTFEALKIDAMSTVDIYCRIAGDDRLGKDMRKDLTPYEFTMALYLISQYSRKLSDTQLSDAMGRMRRDYKQKFKGNKKPTPTATTIFKHLVAFVRKIVPELLHDLRDTNPSMGPAFEYKPVTEPVSPPVTKSRRKKEPIVQKHGTDVDMSDAEALKIPARKRKRVVSPPQTDDDQSFADTESDDDNKVVSKKKVRESTSKPKSALAAPRKSAKTVVKRSRSATAKPASSAPVASTSKAQPVAKETKAGIKGKASMTVKAPTPAASAQSFEDGKMQRAQPSRPLTAARSVPEASPAPNPSVSTRIPLPTRVADHQQTPSNGAPTPPASAPSPAASGSGAGRSPAIPASSPKSIRQPYALVPGPPSASATPANSPPMPHHAPAMDLTPPMEVPPPYGGMGSSVMPKAPFQNARPQPKKPVLWRPPVGNHGSPNEPTPGGAPNAPNSNARVQPVGLTTASRLKAQVPEMIPLGASSNKRGAPDYGNRTTELKRRRTGDGLAELGVGQLQNAGTAEPQRRASVHIPPVQGQQQPFNHRFTPPPSAVDNPPAGGVLHHVGPDTPGSHRSPGSTPSGGSLFSPASGPSAEEELMPAIESLNLQTRESQAHDSRR